MPGTGPLCHVECFALQWVAMEVPGQLCIAAWIRLCMARAGQCKERSLAERAGQDALRGERVIG